MSSSAFHPGVTNCGGRLAHTGCRCGARAGAKTEPLKVLGADQMADVDLRAEFGPIDTPEGAFDRCKVTSAVYTERLLDDGVEAEWVQVVGPTREYPDAHEPWREVPLDWWQHYVTRVTREDGTVEYVDWTHRQFEPDTEWPLIESADVFEARWTDVYELSEDVTRRFARTASRSSRTR